MNAHIGSSFDSILGEKGIKEETENTAVKKITSLGMKKEWCLSVVKSVCLFVLISIQGE